MIKKVLRLPEGCVKKVLKYSKPFFSYGIVANSFINKKNYNRFAIIISGKSVVSAVERNFFRRLFYDNVKENISAPISGGKDIVFVVKKQIKLDKNNFESITNFNKDIFFLIKKING